MARKFETEDTKPIERTYLVDGVYLTEAEFDKHTDRRIWWQYFTGDMFELAGTILILLLGVWLVKG